MTYTASSTSFFPARSKLSTDGFLLAGVPVALSTTLHPFYSKILGKYRATLQRLHQLPNLTFQIRALILTLSCRPTSKFAHILRSHPPSFSAGIPIPDPTLPDSTPKLPFAYQIRQLLVQAFAHILHIPASTFLDSPPPNATHFQLLLRARDGGIGLPDPVALAPAAFLASLADTLPTLLQDPFLEPHLTQTQHWASSPSPTLRDAHRHFAHITSLPRIQDSIAHPDSRSLVELLRLPNHVLHISNLSKLAHRHSQHVFSGAIYGHLLDTALNPSSGLTEYARARLRHSAHPPSHLIFTQYRLTDQTALHNNDFQLLISHRLGFPPPFLPHPLPPHCQLNCRLYSPLKALFPDHDLPELRHHGNHFLSCTSNGLCLKRHNDLTHCIGETARRETGATPHLNHHLASSTTTGTKVDLVLESYYFTPPLVAIDVTVVNPLTTSYYKDAAKDAATVFSRRDYHKTMRHNSLDAPSGRTLIPIVITTLGGIGPPASLDFLHKLFASSLAAELAAGGTGNDTNSRRSRFYQTLLTILARGNTSMMRRLTAPLPSANASHPPAPNPGNSDT